MLLEYSTQWIFDSVFEVIGPIERKALCDCILGVLRLIAKWMGIRYLGFLESFCIRWSLDQDIRNTVIS